MRCGVALVSVVALAGSGLAQVPIGKVRQLRQQRKADKDKIEYLYKFEDEHLTCAAQAGRRGAEAETAWKAIDPAEVRLPVVARSPFGGGESAKSYWPEGVKPELLKIVVAPLKRRGLKVLLPELPDEAPAEVEPKPAKDAPAAADTPPWPAEGFSEDHEFVLVIGLHYEPIPYKAGGRVGGAKGVHIRSSRMTAWAILFHAPTGSGFWATTAAARADHRTRDEPVNDAASRALANLSFSGFGRHNVPDYIAQLAARKELPALDAAAVLAQTQRADAARAVMKSAMTKGAFTNTAWVLRYFNDRGTVQDFRMDAKLAKQGRCVRVSQRVMMRILLIEQLRGMRGVQPCVIIAQVPEIEDYEFPKVGQTYAGRLGPLSGDDEIVLLAELANQSYHGVFRRNATAAVRNVGRCRVHIPEALAVANEFANRKVYRSRRTGKVRRDPLREAGKAALAELHQAAAERRKKKTSRRGGRL